LWGVASNRAEGNGFRVNGGLLLAWGLARSWGLDDVALRRVSSDSIGEPGLLSLNSSTGRLAGRTGELSTGGAYRG
jgi:hypothetical protein